MINSGLTLAKDSFFGESAKDQGITDVKITLKTSNKSAKIDIQFNETNSDDNSVIAAETLFDVKNFKDKSFDYESSSMDNTNNC
jgi:hypothetical protein